ncbi:MAG: TonB-dependent receptor [Balneolaceae bacterium]
MKSKLSHIAIFLLIFSTVSAAVSAQDTGKQTFSFEFRGENLSTVLDRVARETDTDLVFDPQLVQGMTVYQRILNQEMPGLLRNILAEFQLDFITLSTGTIVVVRSVSESPRMGIFAGKITDASTGEPLPGATVMLANAGGGTSSSASGNFSLPGLISGAHQIIISYVGYEAVSLSVVIPPGDRVQRRVELHPKPVMFAPLVVESHRPQMPGSSVFLSDEDLQPGTFTKHAIRNLNLMPGVQHGLPMTDLHIQGGQQSEHRILLDGIPVYNPYSFGQMFSSFSPFAIGRVQLHKAGYGAAEGSQMAGLIDLSHDVNTLENGGLIQADPLSINLRGDYSIPLHNNRAVHTMAAVRTNYWDVHRASTLDNMLNEWDRIDPLIANMLLDDDTEAAFYTPAFRDTDISFFDTHFAAVYEPDDFSSIKGSFYYGENSIQTDLLSRALPGQDMPRFLFASDSHEWSNTVAQLSWNKLLTPRMDLSVQAGYTENRYGHQNSLGTGNASPFPGIATFDSESLSSTRPGIELPTQIDGNRIRHFLSRADASYSISRALSVDAGLQFDNISSRVNLADGAFFGADTDQAASLLSGYLQAAHVLSRFWRLEYGSRLTWLSSTDTFFAEPRAALQYDRPDADIGYWSFRLSGGLFRQFVNEFNVSNTGVSSIVPNFSIWSHTGEGDVPKAYHLTGSFFLEPSPQTSFTVEGFYKWQPTTSITSYSVLSSPDVQNRSDVSAFAETTEMRMMGLGLRVNHTISGTGIRLMGGYDYSYSRLNLESQFGRTLMAPWNEPHRAQLRTFVKLADEVSFVTKWQGIWGRRWAFRESYYNFLLFRDLEPFGGFSFANPDQNRLASFQQVDLSVIYQPSIGTADLEIRLELINVLSRRNVIDQHLTPVAVTEGEIEFEVAERTLPGFYPSVSVQVKF